MQLSSDHGHRKRWGGTEMHEQQNTDNTLSHYIYMLHQCYVPLFPIYSMLETFLAISGWPRKSKVRCATLSAESRLRSDGHTQWHVISYHHHNTTETFASFFSLTNSPSQALKPFHLSLRSWSSISYSGSAGSYWPEAAAYQAGSLGSIFSERS